MTRNEVKKSRGSSTNTLAHWHTQDKSRTVKRRRLIGQRRDHVTIRGSAHTVSGRQDADPKLYTVVFAGQKPHVGGQKRAKDVWWYSFKTDAQCTQFGLYTRSIRTDFKFTCSKDEGLHKTSLKYNKHTSNEIYSTSATKLQQRLP